MHLLCILLIKALVLPIQAGSTSMSLFKAAPDICRQPSSTKCYTLQSCTISRLGTLHLASQQSIQQPYTLEIGMADINLHFPTWIRIIPESLCCSTVGKLTRLKNWLILGPGFDNEERLIAWCWDSRCQRSLTSRINSQWSMILLLYLSAGS